MSVLGRYMGQISQAISSNNSNRLGVLLRLGESLPPNTRSGVLTAARYPSSITRTAKQVLPPPWDTIVAKYLLSIAKLADKSASQALALAREAGEKCLTLMEDSSYSGQNWYLPIVDRVVYQLRVCAYTADQQAGKDVKHQRDIANFIQQFIRTMNKDRSPISVSRKMGCVAMACHLFKIFFRINLLRLTNTLRCLIEAKTFPDLELFPKSQTVTYKFYLGRLLIMEEKYPEAEACLEYALRHCHKDTQGNRRRILQFLVPVKLLLGKFPHPKLLQKYHFPQFQAIATAIRRGDLKAFNDNLVRHEDFFIRKGIFLILEKLRKFVYRNLIRKVYQYGQRDESHKRKALIPLTTIRCAFVVNGVPVAENDFDEIECILANLVYKGLIKGYISHGNCMIVSKKTNPFPRT